MSTGVFRTRFFPPPKSLQAATWIGSRVYTAYWNPADAAAGIQFANANLTAASNSGTDQNVRSNISHASGKWYFEFRQNGTLKVAVGVANGTKSLTEGLYATTNSIGYYSDGGVGYNGGAVATYATYSSSDIIGVAVDVDAGTVWFSKNGTWQSGDPAAGTGGISIASGSPLYAIFGAEPTGSSVTANFGETAFSYGPPSGFTEWYQSANSGSLSATLGSLTLSSAATLGITGTASQTLGAVTLSSAATLAISGSTNATLDALTLSGAAELGITGSLSQTLGALTSTSTATLDITGATSATLGALTLTSAATLGITGSLDATLGSLTVAATGDFTTTGALSVTLGELTATGSATLDISGSLSQTLGSLTAAATGELAASGETGSLNATLGELTVASEATLESSTSLHGRRIKERKPNRRGKVIVFPDELPPEPEIEAPVAPKLPDGPLGIVEAVKALTERLAALQAQKEQAEAVARQRRRQQARIDALKAEIDRVESELRAAIEAEQTWIARLRDDDEWLLLAA